MHSLLETYLSEVEASLSALPTKRRADELREMRTHLENAVTVNREMGQSEDEAARAAVTQFGTARDLGENVAWAWRRGQMLDKRSFWGAVVSTPLTLLALMLVISHLPNAPIPWLDPYCAAHKGFGQALGKTLSDGMFLTAFLLAGAVVGSFCPKQAVRAACSGLTIFFVGWTLADGRSGLPDNWQRVGWVLTVIASAWAVSRLRNTRAGRSRLARR